MRTTRLGVFKAERIEVPLAFTDHRKQLKDAEKPVQSINA